MQTGVAPTDGAQSTKGLVVLAGNPNSGKTTLFNALTGLRHKVANYPGVTVERKSGPLGGARRTAWQVLDLPGTYSLAARSPEELIARQVLLGEEPDTPRPDVVVVVVDASNLDRNLYLVVQILEMGLPAIVALNMWDVAESCGITVDVDRLAQGLGTTVMPTIATRGVGVSELRDHIERRHVPADPQREWRLDPDFEAALADLTESIQAATELSRPAADAESIRLVSGDPPLNSLAGLDDAGLAKTIAPAREALGRGGYEPETFAVEARYAWIRGITRDAVQRAHQPQRSFSDRADTVLTHKIAGPLIFLAVLGIVFQSVFAWAAYPMDLIDRAIGQLGAFVGGLMSEGAFRSLIVDGVIAGVGAVVIFLPQILLIFFLIGLLEDTGYMARAAFMIDRIMRRVGLHGKAFIPLLSSYACAIPGIMATRTIEHERDRLATVLVAPLMTCSARLPVYALLIAAFVPGGAIAKGATLTGLYLLGFVSAILAAFVLKRTLLRSETPPLILELPPYRRPSLRAVALNMWDRGRAFIERAGTIILGVSILLWFLMAYPSPPEGATQVTQAAGATAAVAPQSAQEPTSSTEEVRWSYAGRLGHYLEPIIEPLGFDWRIGVGIIASFAAREVFVGAMGTIFSVDNDDDTTTSLQGKLSNARWESGERAGQPLFTLASALALLVFYVFALQCVSTVATMWRETNSWKWPAFAWAYMAVLAYGGAWIAYTVAGWVS